MTPKEIFGIIVRTLGLFFFIYALYNLLYGIAFCAGILDRNPDYKIAYFVTGTFFFVIGLYLLRGAPLLIRFSYPPGKSTTGDQYATTDPE